MTALVPTATAQHGGLLAIQVARCALVNTAQTVAAAREDSLAFVGQRRELRIS